MDDIWYTPGHAQVDMTLNFVEPDIWDYEIVAFAEWDEDGDPTLVDVYVAGRSIRFRRNDPLAPAYVREFFKQVWTDADARLPEALEDQLREARRVAA